MMSLCYLRPGRVVPSRVMPRYVVVLFRRVCCRAWPYNIYTLNRVLSAAKCCSANWLRILIYAIKCGTDFASLPKLKADAKIRTKIVLQCIVLECFSFMFVSNYPNRIQQALNIYACCRMRILLRWFMHLSYVPHCWKGAPHCLHNTQAPSLSASLSVCVCACKFIDMGLNLIWTVAPIRDAHTCNILFTLVASLGCVLVRNILIASRE